MSKSEKFIHWCDRAMAWTFYALIYFLPISIALLEICTGTAFFFYLLKRGAVLYRIVKNRERGRNGILCFFCNFAKAFKPIPNPLNIPIVIILLVSLISVINSQHLLLSIEGFVGKVLQGVFLYFNFIECIFSRKRLKIFLSVFLVSCLLICINGLYQSVVGHEFIFGHVYDGRISSSLRQANDFGAYLIVIIPILFCLSFLAGFKKQENDTGTTVYFSSLGGRFLCSILFMIALACLGLTYSRGAWLGFILSILAFGTLNRKVFLLFTTITIIFLSIFYPKFAQERIEMIKNKQTFYEHNNRLWYWKRALNIIKDYPLFGCGLNSYALVEGRYSVGWGGYPHNSYLQMAAETGLIGITAFLWMLGVLYRSSLKVLKLIADRNQKMLYIGILTGLLGYLIHSFFDTNFYSVQLGSLMWVMMGLIVAVQRISRASDAAEETVLGFYEQKTKTH